MQKNHLKVSKCVKTFNFDGGFFAGLVTLPAWPAIKPETRYSIVFVNQNLFDPQCLTTLFC